MELDNALKKIRTQIKFGRGIEAGKSLQALWDEFKGADEEKLILEVLAFELLRKKGDCKRAIPVLRRLLELAVDDDIKNQAVEFLDFALKRESLMPSEPDLSRPEFSEFMQAIRERDIFRASLGSSRLPGWFVVEDRIQAEKLAWHQGIEAPFQSWNMLRADASRKIYDYYYENKINMRVTHENLAHEIGEICQQSLSPTMMNFYDDIYGDLALMGMGKLVGVVPDLHRKMWCAYKNKVFPCGWRGDYPKGELCVFPNA